jgi:hypothetical protein
MSGGKPIVGGRIRVGAEFEQLANEIEGTVVDRVDQTRPDAHWHDAVRHRGGIVNRGTQHIQVSLSKRIVDAHNARCVRPRVTARRQRQAQTRLDRAALRPQQDGPAVRADASPLPE